MLYRYLSALAKNSLEEIFHVSTQHVIISEEGQSLLLLSTRKPHESYARH